MSATDQEASVSNNQSTAQPQRGVSRAQKLLMVALVCVVTAGVVVLTGIWPQEDAVIVEPAPYRARTAGPSRRRDTTHQPARACYPCRYPDG